MIGSFDSAGSGKLNFNDFLKGIVQTSAPSDTEITKIFNL